MLEQEEAGAHILTHELNKNYFDCNLKLMREMNLISVEVVGAIDLNEKKCRTKNGHCNCTTLDYDEIVKVFDSVVMLMMPNEVNAQAQELHKRMDLKLKKNNKNIIQHF